MIKPLAEKLSIEDTAEAGLFETYYAAQGIFEQVPPSALRLSARVVEHRIELDEEDNLPF